MKHGLILTASSIQGQMDAAAKADAAGFESVWTTEFFNAHGFGRLAAAAGATQRVQLGTGIA
ncbi:MAG: LLM class flavin-dependent oxidoreductase [Gammaproteobacteria bacterium]|nr:MAG: LLM class flavin-dependent oxidoreductase [Gammaproteobacteria bacterium]